MPTPTPALRCAGLLLATVTAHLSATVAMSQNPTESASDRRPLRIDDIVGQESVQSIELSPDGRRMLWLRMRPDEEKDRLAPTLMLTEFGSGEDSAPEHRELTVGRWDIDAPKWSPDGQRIAFLSSHDFPDGVEDLPKDDRGAQIWLLDLRGGMARPLTKVPHGVRSFAWRNDGEFLLTARVAKTREERLEDERKDKSEAVEDLERFRRTRNLLWSFEIEGSKLRRLIDGGDTSIARFTMAPEGDFVVAWHDVDPRHRAQNDRPPRVILHALGGTRESYEIWPDRRNKPTQVVFTDPRHALVTAPRSSVDGEDWAAVVDLWEMEPGDDGPMLRPYPLDWDRGLAGSPIVRGSTWLVPLANGTRPKWVCLATLDRSQPSGTGWRIDVDAPELPPVHGLVGRRECDTLLAIVGDASTPDAIHRLDFAFDRKACRLENGLLVYRPNDGFAKRRLAESEVITWTGALDETVEGILYYPTDYREGQRYPLVLVTHGGPHASDQDRFTERWANSPNLYAGRGAFVLKTNYHGSSDYGLEFGESIKGRYYELELIDLAKGIQKLCDDGKVDPARLGLVGWSNGAILSIAMLTHLDDYLPGHGLEFRACAPGAGDVNWTSDFGNCAFGAGFDRFYVGGSPWNRPEAYFDKSPLFRMEEVDTPTIVFFGSEDKAVPTEQGWQHFRAMQSIGKADVKFLLFAGEGHGLAKLSHQRRKLVEELAWFDRFLFETESSTWPEKLGRLDEVERVPCLRHRDRPFGVVERDLLLPEMIAVRVPIESDKNATRRVRVSRFEVTEAQWAAFTPRNGRARHPNLPAVGMSLAEVERYIDWLNDRTGRRFRLPTRAELESLSGSKDENTLERWAGFVPNVDEAARLETTVDGMSPDSLLWPVGSGRASVVGEDLERELLYDRGGNAAEWVVDGDLKRAIGPCVARSNDESAGDREFPIAFTGLRLIEELDEEGR